MPEGWNRFKVTAYGREFYSTTVKLLHEECGHICGWCSGSGEGMADGSSCMNCRGRGEITYGPGYESWFEVEWSKEDLSDLEIIDGSHPTECESCGHDLTEDIMEELKWLKEQQ